MTNAQTPAAPPPEGASFAETALKLGGKSDEEARRTGAIDKADDQVESLFEKRFQTINSPIHVAVWDSPVPVQEFRAAKEETPGDVARVMSDSLALVKRHREAGTLHTPQGKIADIVLNDLA